MMEFQFLLHAFEVQSFFSPSCLYSARLVILFFGRVRDTLFAKNVLNMRGKDCN